MSKGFDSLHHSLLLSILEAYGFSADATSEWVEVKRGSPQGSNLGPLLWNVFPERFITQCWGVSKENFMMYADDHQSTLNKEGKSVSGWYQINQLQGNLK